MAKEKTQRIRELNDAARQNFLDCRVQVTKGVQSQADVPGILELVRKYEDFTPENDPYGEHDFGSFKVADQTIFWKFDYYDLDLTMQSLDPAEPSITVRVLTIMLDSEY